MGTLRESTEYAEAVATAERYLAMSGRHSWVLAELTWTYADWGRAEEARAVYQELEARSARERFQPIMLASAAAAVGELDAAVTYAQMGLEQRDLLLVVMARTWPGLEPIREDPRMQAITQELRYPE